MIERGWLRANILEAHCWHAFLLVPSTCDRLFEAVMMSDGTIRFGPSLKERKRVSEDAKIKQSTKEEQRYVCADNGCTEKIVLLIVFSEG